MGVCNCSMYCCTLLYVHSSIAIIFMGKRELIALLNLSSWCLVMVERLFLAVPRGCLQFVIVVFPDHTHLLFKMTDVIQLTHDVIAAVTEDDWASSCGHVEEIEMKYWDADIAVEAEMEKIVIQVTSSDEDTDTATECSDYSDSESAYEDCLC